jgi:hypothetical protein
MELNFKGLAIKQNGRPAKGNYPASTNITFLDQETGTQFEVNSPVAIEPKYMLVAANWRLLGFGERLISWRATNEREAGSFVQKYCSAVTGELVKA